jgi:hypothetical protein
MASSHPAYANDSFGKVVTGSQKTFAKYMPGDNGYPSQRQKTAFDKGSSGGIRFFVHCMNFEKTIE